MWVVFRPTMSRGTRWLFILGGGLVGGIVALVFLSRSGDVDLAVRLVPVASACVAGMLANVLIVILKKPRRTANAKTLEDATMQQSE